MKKGRRKQSKKAPKLPTNQKRGGMRLAPRQPLPRPPEPKRRAEQTPPEEADEPPTDKEARE
jgi:hypothetical protein